MAKQTVNVGANANDGSGDAARSAFTKINQNFDEVYGATGNATNPTDLAKAIGTVGIGQAIQNVTTARSLSTNYINSTGRAIFVTILLFLKYNPGARVYCYVDDIPIIENYVPFGDSVANHRWFTFLVPPNGKYSIFPNGTFDSISLDRWTELR